MEELHREKEAVLIKAANEKVISCRIVEEYDL